MKHFSSHVHRFPLGTPRLIFNSGSQEVTPTFDSKEYPIYDQAIVQKVEAVVDQFAKFASNVASGPDAPDGWIPDPKTEQFVEVAVATDGIQSIKKEGFTKQSVKEMITALEQIAKDSNGEYTFSQVFATFGDQIDKLRQADNNNRNIVSNHWEGFCNYIGSWTGWDKEPSAIIEELSISLGLLQEVNTEKSALNEEVTQNQDHSNQTVIPGNSTESIDTTVVDAATKNISLQTQKVEDYLQDLFGSWHSFGKANVDNGIFWPFGTDLNSLAEKATAPNADPETQARFQSYKKEFQDIIGKAVHNLIGNKNKLDTNVALQIGQDDNGLEGFVTQIQRLTRGSGEEYPLHNDFRQAILTAVTGALFSTQFDSTDIKAPTYDFSHLKGLPTSTPTEKATYALKAVKYLSAADKIISSTQASDKAKDGGSHLFQLGVVDQLFQSPSNPIDFSTLRSWYDNQISRNHPNERTELSRLLGPALKADYTPQINQ